MILRLVVCLTLFSLYALPTQAEVINLRQSCGPWEYVPKSESLGNPPTALLGCSDDTNTWLAMQLICDEATAEIEIRYKPGFPTLPPQSETSTSNDTNTTTGGTKPLGAKEMLFFDFPGLGVTSVVQYAFDTQDWHYREQEPLAALFRTLVGGSYADITLLATEKTERLPLKGSRKAIGPVVEACRVAKVALDKKAEENSGN